MPTNEPLNRKLRMGLVGGGQGAFIGRVHATAAILDNRAALVAGAFVCYALFPGAAAAYMAGTVVFSFGELVFSSAVPAAVARLAPPGRRGAYQGGWALVQSLSMGSALFLSGLLSDAIGWRGAWLLYAGLTLAVAAVLFATREQFTAP